MATSEKSTKAKAARRVIEVLDFFDEHHRHATVMDISRRYNRPQSSTSELLASLVEMGLLYKNPLSRTYSLTPRAAILGSISQPRVVRAGSLCALIDELSTTTKLGVALIGMVGPKAQVFRWTTGSKSANWTRGFAGGAQDVLTATAAGWLLLSTVGQPRRDGLIRRINAEASEEHKFNATEMSSLIHECGRRGFSTGPAGFGAPASSTAVLIPCPGDDHPMAVALVYDGCAGVEPSRLVAQLRQATSRLAGSSFDGAFGSSASAAYSREAANAA